MLGIFFDFIYEYLLFAIALIGSALGGYIDLKTTEIPDEVPLFIGASGILLRLLHSIYTKNFFEIKYALLVGIVFLIFGYILYHANQWGEADVLLLGALGFILPLPLSFFNMSFSSLFPLILLANIFIVGGVYSIAYSIVVMYKTKGTFTHLLQDLKKRKAFLAIIPAFYIIFLILSRFFIIYTFKTTLPIGLLLQKTWYLLVLTYFAFFIYLLARAVDQYAFRKQILAKDLREGDVLAESISDEFKGKIWVGLEEDEIKEIRKTKKKVWIKEGVRFAPTFALALLFTCFYGDLLLRLLL